jgi:hypothetical protein
MGGLTWANVAQAWTKANHGGRGRMSQGRDSQRVDLCS